MASPPTSSSDSDAAAPAAEVPIDFAAMSRAEFNAHTLALALRSPGISAECDWCIEYVRRCGAEVVGPTGFAAMSCADFNTYTLTVALRDPHVSADWCAEYIRRCGAQNFTRYLGEEHGYDSPARALLVNKYDEWNRQHLHFRAGRAADVLRVLATLPSYSPNPHPNGDWESSLLLHALMMDANDAGVQRFVSILLEAPPGANLHRICNNWTGESMIDMIHSNHWRFSASVLACELARRRFLLYRILQLPTTSRYRLPGQPELAPPRLDQDLAKCVARQLTL
jgi:hypothetical protein